MRFLDANIFLRFLTRDDAVKAAACLELFRHLEHSEEQATSCEVILHEVLYVLTSRKQYGLSHAEAAARLRPILALRGLQLPQKRVCQRALDLFGASTDLDFGDALSIAHMEAQGIVEIYSYDRDFDAVPGVHRIEP